MRLFALLAWLAFPVAAYAAWNTYGPPYFIWSYTYRDMGGGHRHHSTFTYIGWGFASATRPARGGSCPWVRFFGAEDR